MSVLTPSPDDETLRAFAVTAEAPTELELEADDGGQEDRRTGTADETQGNVGRT